MGFHALQQSGYIQASLKNVWEILECSVEKASNPNCEGDIEQGTDDDLHVSDLGTPIPTPWPVEVIDHSLIKVR